LLLDVAGELDGLHAVVQRLGYLLRVVRRGYEEDLGEVERHAEVVVDEVRVLRRVEDLEQRRGGVALEGRAQLVHLVEQEHRVLGARLADALDDAARHGADVRAAVAADVGLVARAAKTYADVLAAQRLGDGLRDARLANAGRADEEQDGPAVDLEGVDLAVLRPLALQLAHGQVLEHAVLDLLEAVVVLVEDLLGVLELEAVLGADVPWQLDDRREVRADHRGFRRVWVHAGQAVELALGLLHDDLGQLEGLELLAERLDLVLLVVGTRQLLLECLDLLAEEELALVAVDLVLDLALEATLGLLQLDLGVDEHQHLAEPLRDGGRLEHGLLVRQLEVQVVRDVIGELAGVLQVEDELRDLALDRAAAGLHEVLDLLPELAERGYELHLVAVWDVDGGDLGLDEAVLVLVAVDTNACERPDEHLDRAVWVLLHPHDVACGAGLVEVLRRRLLDLAVLLTHDDDGAVAV